jgi:hypothetical protein
VRRDGESSDLVGITSSLERGKRSAFNIVEMIMAENHLIDGLQASGQSRIQIRIAMRILKGIGIILILGIVFIAIAKIGVAAQLVARDSLLPAAHTAVAQELNLPVRSLSRELTCEVVSLNPCNKSLNLGSSLGPDNARYDLLPTPPQLPLLSRNVSLAPSNVALRAQLGVSLHQDLDLHLVGDLMLGNTSALLCG